MQKFAFFVANSTYGPPSNRKHYAFSTVEVYFNQGVLKVEQMANFKFNVPWQQGVCANAVKHVIRRLFDHGNEVPVKIAIGGVMMAGIMAELFKMDSLESVENRASLLCEMVCVGRTTEGQLCLQSDLHRQPERDNFDILWRELKVSSS